MLFFSTHPPSAERVDTLKQRAQATPEPESGWHTGTERYNEIVDPLRFGLWRDELRLRRFDATQLTAQFAQLYNELLRSLGRVDRASLHASFLGASKKVGRNDTCPCGSGKKYKSAALNTDPDCSR